MTNIKEKITSKNGKTLFFTIIIATMVATISVGNNADNVFAAEKTSSGFTDEQKEKYLSMVENKAKVTNTMSQIKKDRINEKIMADQRIQDLTKNHKVILNSYSYHGYLDELEKDPNVVLDIVLHYTVDDKSLTVMVDGETDEILGIHMESIDGKMPANNAHIVKYPTVFNPALDGIRMDMHAPDFTGESNTGSTFLLLNAQKYYNDPPSVDVCDSNDFPDAYWQQVGLRFDADGDMIIVWTDTLEECVPRTLMTDLSGSHGTPSNVDEDDDLIFQIDADDSTDKWTLYAINNSKSEFWYHTETVSGTDDFLRHHTTSVFYENPQDADDGWSAGFNEDPLVDNAYYRSVSTGVWDYWDSETADDINCHPGGQSASDYISGDSENGITFDVAEIDDSCGNQ
ncbi:MAG TPA: hypothetical protein VFM64_01285 [Candidatus Nitrosotenuis sp.]|nr:hypothetical protein [Candidatus Nitrosotenuis sp.]